MMQANRFVILSVVAIALAAPASMVVAQSPLGTAFTYQGLLKQAGLPLNDTADFEFSLWDEAGTGQPPTGGNQVGATQTVSGVQVSYGLFTVQLNGGGEFGAGAFSGEACWLQIAVRSPAGGGNFTTLSPRQPVTPAPYALYAASGPGSGGGGNTLDDAYNEGGAGEGRTITANAGAVQIAGADGLSVNGNVAVGGTVGIGTGPGAAQLYVRGIVSNAAVWAEQIQPQGSAGLFEISALNNPDAAVSAITVGTGPAVAGTSDQLGTGPAGSFTINAAGNDSAAVEATTVGIGAAVAGTSAMDGIGPAGSFRIMDAFNSSPAVDAATAGTGNAGAFSITNASNSAAAVNAMTQGTGNAGYFEIQNSANDSAAVEVWTNGTSNAGYFEILNDNATSAALEAVTNANESAFEAWTTGGLGSAGRFEVLDPTNPDPTIMATMDGDGSAGVFEIHNLNNQDPAVSAVTFGEGQAGSFEIANSANDAPAVEVWTNGTGNAGHFEILNVDATSAALEVVTNADESALEASTTGSLGSAGVFEVHDPNNPDPAIRATMHGDGSAGLFEIYYTDNMSPAVEAFTYGINSAGYFEIRNPNNDSAALEVTTNGTGSAADFQVDNQNSYNPGVAVFTNGYGSAVQVISNGNGSAVEALVDGAAGNAGIFRIQNSDSWYTAVEVTTSGHGSAASFRIDNVNTPSPTVLAETEASAGYGGRFVALNSDSDSYSTALEGLAWGGEGTGVAGFAGGGGQTTGVYGRISSSDEAAEGVRAEGAGAIGPGQPMGAALNIDNGAITVSGGERPAGAITVAAPSDQVLSCFENVPCEQCPSHCHVIGWQSSQTIQNQLIKPDSIILLTLKGVGAYPYSVSIESQSPGTADIRIMAHGGQCDVACPPPTDNVTVNYLIINPL